MESSPEDLVIGTISVALSSRDAECSFKSIASRNIMFLHQREDCVSFKKRRQERKKKGSKGDKITRYTSRLA